MMALLLAVAAGPAPLRSTVVQVEDAATHAVRLKLAFVRMRGAVALAGGKASALDGIEARYDALIDCLLDEDAPRSLERLTGAIKAAEGVRERLDKAKLPAAHAREAARLLREQEEIERLAKRLRESLLRALLDG
ncbi:MAG: hypothetical protein K2W96_20720 [Gemmataceae bacterium]|nr:hypothetical protein [Gemmataceae bacterium]